ncbi:hypothetical protein Pmar_PMAR011969 [Perkinsus marinus ATCC 50983]|uniref:Uncharacterized protein n=1 Tax=Perkinsus marinus (strain ATCC 50983 / TXsc) TaxID=423536 RepID=C5LBU0_PERM5|nr:hypothetical protein Pmar_PMAR011969 [Perkinsus marinus ATCC 50983]EER05911.1 hypothetical protein Pmar_PMAR011969 [Perkinsus marinus ATCC 50983]|eukprot:XP_002774095.1 hypothetical protein Pmar_PMAR011969 [Perkinsus marinus ATCC 50983]
MDHGRRASTLLNYLEKIRARAQRDVSLGVTPNALRANAEEKRRRNAARRVRRIVVEDSEEVHYPTHEPSEPSITELEDLRGERIEMIPSDETAVVEDAPIQSSEIRADADSGQRVKVVGGNRQVQSATLREWQDTVRELMGLIEEAEVNGMPEEELEELRRMVSVDLEEGWLVPVVEEMLNKLVDEEVVRLHAVLLRSAEGLSTVDNTPDNSTDAASSSLTEVEYLRMKYLVS